MSSCFKCGTSLVNAKSVSKIIGKELEEDSQFQDYFLQIYKIEQWHGEHLARDRFLKLLWQLVSAMRKNLLTKYHSKAYETWEQYVKRICCSLEKTASAISAVFQTVRLDPERLERPFLCATDKRKFATLTSYLNHWITHLPIKCPLDTCQGEEILVLKEGYLCRSCGTEFWMDGTITKTGMKLSCPLQTCKSYNVRFGK